MPNPAVLRSRLRVPHTIIVSRAVYPKHFVGQAFRLAFLCDKDAITSRNFEHRRQWIEDKLYFLSGIFSAALMACLAYVDLNPVRVGMAKTPEASKHTSIKKRIAQAETTHIANHPQQQVKGLFPFVGNPRDEMPSGLAFKLTDYLELVDWSGRILRKGKCGNIDSECPPILERLNIESDHWSYLINHFESRFKSLACWHGVQIEAGISIVGVSTYAGHS